MILEKYDDLTEQLSQAAHKLYRLRYQMSNGGNVSVRVPGMDAMIVKGTDVAFDEVDKNTVVVTDFDGKLIEGQGKPSKEALLHGALYRQMPEVNAVMHCHSPYAVAWAAKHERLEFATYHSELKLHGGVPVFDTHSYAVPQECFPMILSWLNRYPDGNAFLLRGHGQVTMAEDMRMAAYLAELVEETAQIALLSE